MRNDSNHPETRRAIQKGVHEPSAGQGKSWNGSFKFC